MADPELLKRLNQGVAKWNEWRKQNQWRELDEWREQKECMHPNLSGADLRNADLSDAILLNANLSGANLSGAYLRDADLSDVWREIDLTILDLGNDIPPSFVYLRNANLSDADLNRADLNSVDLERANLNGAGLIDARLNHVSLRSAMLRGTHLSGADLSHADLNHVDLSGADLSFSDLRGANLSGARTSDTVFTNLDLRTVKGLAEINHEGPSHVELYTVRLPQDGSALHFLRGAGVPDEWIDFWRSTMMHPIQYYSCFISYSSKDEMLARRLYADLQASGVRCWFAPEDMKIGDKIRRRIDEAIHLQDKLLLLLSEHSIVSSWVEDEAEAALEKEQRQQREVLFPVRLDESVMQTTQAWTAKVRRTRHIGDFTRWTDPQAYQRAFERLLRDLKAEKELGNQQAQ